MRAIWVLLAAAVGVGGGVWLLRDREAEGVPGDLGTDGARTGPQEPGLLSVDRVHLQRVGVGTAADRRLTADPEAPPWRERLLRFSVPAGKRATGEDVIQAVAQHFYVRAPDAETLTALRSVTLEMELPPEMPLSALEPLLRRAGYAFEVKDPLFVVHRLKPGQRVPGAGEDPR